MKTKGKILVTGGAGYIGSHTIIELLRANYEVVSVDNFSNSSKKTFSRIKKITGISIKNHDVDLSDFKKTESLFAKEKNITGIIHFAALKSVGESVEQPVRYFTNNIDSLLSVVRCAERYGISSFVFSSSCSVYGNVEKLPVSETTPFGVAESPYARTKQIGEMILKDVSRISKTKFLALRYFNPVGAHESGYIGEEPTQSPNNLVPVITGVGCGKRPSLTVYGGNYKTRDGSAVRDYVHVSDIARAHVLALAALSKKDAASFDVINLGTGTGVTVLEMIKAFEKVSSVKLAYTIGPRRAGDVVAVYSDARKAKRVLGWKPKFGIEEMLESAWKWETSSKS